MSEISLFWMLCIDTKLHVEESLFPWEKLSKPSFQYSLRWLPRVFTNTLAMERGLEKET